MALVSGGGGRRRDIAILFATRSLRMFAYGLLSVVLVLYLAGLGFGEGRIGLLLTLTLAGDTLMSLFMTTRADRLGRKAMLAAGALLMCLAGLPFALSRDFVLLVIAAAVGVLSPSGNEVGPFLAIEQAALSEVVDKTRRTALFARYNLAGSFSTALGALVGGWTAQSLQAAGMGAPESYRVLVFAYAASGLVLALMFIMLSTSVEHARAVPAAETAADAGAQAAAKEGGRRATVFGLGESRGAVFRLAGLFSIDAFAGGFVIQSFVALWFHRRFGMESGLIGTIFFFANLLAGFSALGAAGIAKRIGLVNTMVFTHVPSNILLILVPLMPTAPLAIALLLARFSISQMDVPTRQSYTMSIVRPEERSAAAGVTGVARTTGASLGPVLAGQLLASPALAGLPFIVAGGLKIVYDLLLYRNFRRVGERG